MARPRPDTTTSPAVDSFDELGVSPKLSADLTRQGIERPFPIQSATLPDSLAGRDVLGRGRTGSGKTLAFVLPLVQRLAESNHTTRRAAPRGLILAPTRELARQIDEVVRPLAARVGLRSTTVFGGVGARPQVDAFNRGVDIVIACPGRLLDHMGNGAVRLDAVEITVLDEADHMADLGFLPSVKRILDRTPRGSQRMLFSATLDNGVDGLVRRYLDRPVTHSVDEESAPNADLIHHVLHVDDADRVGLLVDMLSRSDRTVVFTRTKHRAKRLTKQLVSAGVAAVELHGNLSQGARIRNLDAFGDGSAVALVATDIAARGIHVDDVGLVIHADPPVEHKAYVHRSGRTARAGSSGVVVTMMTDEQRSDVAALTRKAGVKPTTTRASAVSDLDGLGIVGATIVMPAVRNLPSAGSARSGPRPSTSEGARSGGARRPNRSKAGSNRAAPTEAARPGGGRRRRRRRAGRPSASAV